MSASAETRPLTPGQQAIIDDLQLLPLVEPTLLTTWMHKRREEQVKQFIASLVDPPPPPVDLSNARECLYASITGLGYVAGLAGSRQPHLFSGQAAKVWQDGWRQGRDHRARSFTPIISREFLNHETLKAMLIRMEQPPGGL